MTMTATSPKVLHVEVSAEAPQDLRARLRMSPLTAEAATLLPGGVIHEDRESAHLYRLGGHGPWRLDTTAEGPAFVSEAGHRVALTASGQLVLTLSK